MTKLVSLNAQYMHVNLGVRQIMKALPDGSDAAIYESNINVPFHQLLEEVAAGHPRAIGFSTYIWNAELVMRLARALKAALPDVFLFAGGPEVSPEPAQIMRGNPALDGVLSGEGELTVAPLIEALGTRDFSRVPGLTWRGGDQIIKNAPPPLLPAEDFVDVWADLPRKLASRILYVETSRGCPYRCGYCLSGGAGAVRALDAGESIRRLTHMADRGAALIKLVDRTFNFDKARSLAIWRGLIEHAKRTGLRPTYHFEIGAHLLDEDALALLKTAPGGLFQFEAGIQSSDEGVLATVRRGVTFRALKAPLARAAALNNIHLHVDLIAGLPGESYETFGRSFDDAYRVGAQMLQLGFLKLLRGSALRADAEEHGIAFAPDPPYEVLRTRAIGFYELCMLKDVERALEWYKNSGRYENTLRFLLADEGSPFALFERIARSLRASGALDRPQSEKSRAAELLGLFDGSEVRALMTHDLLLAGRRRDLPDALVFEEDAELRAELRRRFHPVRGHSARRYPYDVEAFAQGGALVGRETTVFYGA